MSLPFIPVVDVSAAERWRALDFRWSQDARSDAGVQQGTKQRYATIKGRSRGICHGKIEEQQAILGQQKWLGSVFARCGQTWVSKNPCFFLGGATFWLRHFNTIWGWPSLLLLFGENGIYITNRYGCEFMLHQLHGYGSWWIFQREKTEEVRSSYFWLGLVICLHIVHDYSADYTSG